MDWGRSGRIAREAAAWVVLIDSDAFDAAVAQRFRRWLGRSSEHVSAYKRSERAWTELDRLSQLRAYPEIVALLEAPEAGTAAETAAGREPGAAPAPRSTGLDRRALLAGAGFAALVIGAGGYALLSANTAQAYETGIGEQRELTLADGTTIALNAATRIETRLGRGRRQARLVAGEALFFVAADRDLRPFRIETPAGAIEAESGEVLVKILPNGVRVGFLSGAGRALAQPDADAANSRAIAAGAEIVFEAGHLSVAGPAPERLARRALWREGWLAFEDTPLAEAAADMSAQTGVDFVFADPALGDLRVGGLMRLDDLDAFLVLLRDNLAIEAQRSDDTIVLRALRITDHPRVITSE